MSTHVGSYRHGAGATTVTFAKVWVALLVLTGVEVLLAYEQVPTLIMLTALLGLSIIKAALIIAYFMHLKFERLSLFLTLFPMLIFCIVLMLIFLGDASHPAYEAVRMKRLLLIAAISRWLLRRAVRDVLPHRARAEPGPLARAGLRHPDSGRPAVSDSGRVHRVRVPKREPVPRIAGNSVNGMLFGRTMKPLQTAALVLSLFPFPGLAQSHAGWSDYGGAADSAQYSALKQVNRSNVSKLQMAWTYPTGDNRTYNFNPLVVGRRHVRPGQEQLHRGPGRRNRQGDLGPRSGPRNDDHHEPRHQLLGEQGPLRPAPALREQPRAARHRRAHREAHHHVRR